MHSWEKYAYPVPVAAKLICRSRYYLYDAIERGELKAHRPNPNGDLIILNEDLKAWLKANPYDPTGKKLVAGAGAE